MDKSNKKKKQKIVERAGGFVSFPLAREAWILALELDILYYCNIFPGCLMFLERKR
jgi:hypothetical protein